MQFIAGYPQMNMAHILRQLLPSRYCADSLKPEGIEFQLAGDVTDNDVKAGDAILFQGLINECIVGKMSNFQRKGVKIIQGLDDDFSTIPPWNYVTRDLEREFMGSFHWAKNNADWLLCTTEHLANTFPTELIGPRVRVAPNLFECDYYLMPPRKPQKIGNTSRQIRILWAGSPTHLGDQELLVEPIGRLIAKYRAKVCFVFFGECHSELIRRHLNQGVQAIPYMTTDKYLGQLRAIEPDIWLAPLQDIPFNWSRSQLKVLEGQAMGVPVVASPVRTYDNVIDNGRTGFFAGSAKEWYAILATLIESEELRQQIGGAGQEYVTANWNWGEPNCFEPWVNFFREVAAS